MPDSPSTQSGSLRFVRSAMEAVVLALVAVTPWYYGGIEGPAVLGIHLGVSLLLILWGIRVYLEKKLPWRPDAALFCLFGLVALSVAQLIPVPPALLKVVSPTAAELRRDLIPEQSERLSGEPQSHRPDWSPISLAPEETRRFLFMLANLIVVYSVTRFYLISKDTFNRLAWVCLVNGALLSLFGMMQYYSCSANVIYFNEVIDGAGVFSTFVCRNHFPDYACLCVGLGATLLAVDAPRYIRSPRHARARLQAIGANNPLHSTRAMWLLVAITTTLTGVAFSLSRGGILSCLVAAGLCGAISFRRDKSLGPILFAPVFALAMIVLLGIGPVDERLGSISPDGFRAESRVNIWRQAMNLIPKFLTVGSGNNSYGIVEPLGRFDPSSAKWMMDSAHNEYLQALFEGGLPRLTLTLILAALIPITAVRAVSRLESNSARRFVLCCFFGLSALAVHSFVDFGVVIPAVALLAVVALAQFTGWSASERRRSSSHSGFGVIAALPICILLSALLTWEGWHYCRGEEAKREALFLARDSKSDTLDSRLDLLKRAVRHEPNDGQTHSQLGDAYLEVSRRFPNDSAEAQKYLVAALGEWRAARNLLPTLATPHARLGVYRDGFESAEPAIAYLDRAVRCAPNDQDVWYYAGRLRYEAGDWDAALTDWKRSLQLGGSQAEPIVRMASKRLKPSELIDTLLPPDPALLIRVADALYPKKGDETSPERQVYLSQAAKLWDAAHPSDSADLIRLAGLFLETGQYPKAIENYRRVADREPSQVPWRLELVQIYRSSGDYTAAVEELEKLIREDRGSKEIKDLLKVIEHEKELKE